MQTGASETSLLSATARAALNSILWRESRYRRRCYGYPPRRGQRSKGAPPARWVVRALVRRIWATGEREAIASSATGIKRDTYDSPHQSRGAERPETRPAERLCCKRRLFTVFLEAKPSPYSPGMPVRRLMSAPIFGHTATDEPARGALLGRKPK